MFMDTNTFSTYTYGLVVTLPKLHKASILDKI